MPKGFMSSSIIHNCIYLSQNPQTFLKSLKYSIYPWWHVVAYFYFISISPWHVCSHNKSISFVTPEQILRNTPQLPEQPSLSRSLDPLSPPIPYWLKNKIANSKNNIKQYPFLPDDEEKEDEEEEDK